MAETAKHSPGPWRAAFGDDWRPRATESDIEIACLPHYTCDAIQVFGPELDRELMPEELLANAHLIAAAPDLLEALRRYTDPLKCHMTDKERFDSAMAAIAKAEGRP